MKIILLSRLLTGALFEYGSLRVTIEKLNESLASIFLYSVTNRLVDK